MENLKNEIKRKIRIRKFAIDNLGRGIDSNGPETDSLNIEDQIQILNSHIYENIAEADKNKFQSCYSNITSHRKLSKFFVFIKKAIRKIFLGWFARPILEKQSLYNGKIINSVELLRQMMILQEQNNRQELIHLEDKIMCYENTIEKLNQSINELTKNIFEIGNKNIENINQLIELKDKVSYIFKRLNVSCDIKLLQQNEIDYFNFENAYRGSRSSIKEIQSVYVPYFKVNGEDPILDLGCGRGEFLELMWDNGIHAYGVDSYEPFVNYCRERGLNVKMSDALTHLNTLEDCSIGGIFMSQLVEHLSDDYVRALIIMAYKKLKPGCYFILETPNPDCLAAISEFNIDMSHIKPVHYKALEFLFKEANYTSVEQYHTKQTIYPVNAKHINGENIKNIHEFNQGIDQINKLLFGYRDYTLIAKK